MTIHCLSLVGLHGVHVLFYVNFLPDYETSRNSCSYTKELKNQINISVLRDSVAVKDDIPWR